MAAGLGFKDFTTGEVLTAADVDGYLMQGIWVFASTAARDAAVTAPAEGNFAFTKDTNSLWYYDGAAWVASGATGDIEGVTAGTGISGGGTSGTVTITNSMATAIDAKGDLVVGTGADTFSRLAVGTNNYVLTADSAEATGLKWAAAGSAGMDLIKTQTIGTAVTTVAVTSAFSATYDTYLIVITGGVGSSSNRLELQMGATTTGYYACGQSINYTTGTFVTRRDNNAAAWTYGGTYTANGINVYAILQNPFNAKYTTISNTFTYSDTAEGSGYLEGILANTTSYTGFTFNTISAATMTGGTIRVYGLKAA